jgi:hypothetical protein
MTRLAASLLGLAVIAPGLSSAQSGVTPGTLLLGQSKNDDAAKCVDLTIIARDGKFLR